MRVPIDAIGQRLDIALLHALESLGHSISRSRLQAAFAAGEVVGAGGPLKPGRKIESPLEVELVLPRAAPLRADPEDIPLAIVHEDEHVLVIDKPAGMVVHRGAGHVHGTLVSAVLHHLGPGHSLPVLPGNDATRPGIVHRLDKGTSGLLVVAKTTRAQDVLAEQFRAHTIERSYTGFVQGRLDFVTRTIETGHGRDPRNRMRFCTSGPRRAVTRLEVLGTSTEASLLRFSLETGRTHQIRVHAAHLGHPIVADRLYGALASPLLPDRHALHAALLGFRHPDGQTLRFTSSLPADLVALAAELHLEVRP